MHKEQNIAALAKLNERLKPLARDMAFELSRNLIYSSTDLYLDEGVRQIVYLFNDYFFYGVFLSEKKFGFDTEHFLPLSHVSISIVPQKRENFTFVPHATTDLMSDRFLWQFQSDCSTSENSWKCYSAPLCLKIEQEYLVYQRAESHPGVPLGDMNILDFRSLTQLNLVSKMLRPVRRISCEFFEKCTEEQASLLDKTEDVLVVSLKNPSEDRLEFPTLPLFFRSLSQLSLHKWTAAINRISASFELKPNEARKVMRASTEKSASVASHMLLSSKQRPLEVLAGEDIVEQKIRALVDYTVSFFANETLLYYYFQSKNAPDDSEESRRSYFIALTNLRFIKVMEGKLYKMALLSEVAFADDEDKGPLKQAKIWLYWVQGGCITFGTSNYDVAHFFAAAIMTLLPVQQHVPWPDVILRVQLLNEFPDAQGRTVSGSVITLKSSLGMRIAELKAEVFKKLAPKLPPGYRLPSAASKLRFQRKEDGGFLHDNFNLWYCLLFVSRRMEAIKSGSFDSDQSTSKIASRASISVSSAAVAGAPRAAVKHQLFLENPFLQEEEDSGGSGSEGEWVQLDDRSDLEDGDVPPLKTRTCRVGSEPSDGENSAELASSTSTPYNDIAERVSDEEHLKRHARRKLAGDSL